MADCLCDRCTALCCRYFALEIDTPESPEDFDDVRWYLAHESVHVFIEDDKWHISVQTRCQYLRDDNRCGTYEDRPKICRQYSTENCDYHIGEYDYQQYFTTPEQLEAYAQATLGKRYARYALKQRLKNVGLDKNHPDRPSHDDVLAARARPRIKGHPSHGGSRRHHPGPIGAGDGPAVVPLSVKGRKPAKPAKSAKTAKP